MLVNAQLRIFVKPRKKRAKSEICLMLQNWSFRKFSSPYCRHHFSFFPVRLSGGKKKIWPSDFPEKPRLAMHEYGFSYL